MANYCEKCGGPLAEGAANCQRCGAAVPTLSYMPQQRSDTIVEKPRPATVVEAAPQRVVTVSAEPPQEKVGFLSRLREKRGKPKKGNRRETKRDAAPATPNGWESNQTVVEPGVKRSSVPNDSPTVVGRNAARPYLIRHRTGEKLYLDCPAIVGKGSAATCLVSGNPGISRRHARIAVNGGGYTIENLSNTNGTWVNDMQLILNDSRVLDDGARLTFADESFTFRIS